MANRFVLRKTKQKYVEIRVTIFSLVILTLHYESDLFYYAHFVSVDEDYSVFHGIMAGQIMDRQITLRIKTKTKTLKRHYEEIHIIKEIKLR